MKMRILWSLIMRLQRSKSKNSISYYITRGSVTKKVYLPPVLSRSLVLQLKLLKSMVLMLILNSGACRDLQNWKLLKRPVSLFLSLLNLWQVLHMRQVYRDFLIQDICGFRNSFTLCLS